AVGAHVLARDAELRVRTAYDRHVVGALDGGADGLPHAPRGARHRDVDHAAAASSGLTGSSARTNASSSPPTPAADRRTGANSSSASTVTSSALTASI